MLSQLLDTGIFGETNPRFCLASVIVAAKRISGQELMDAFIQELIVGADKDEFVNLTNQAIKRIERVCLDSSSTSEWKELFKCSNTEILRISSTITASLCQDIESDYLN